LTAEQLNFLYVSLNRVLSCGMMFAVIGDFFQKKNNVKQKTILFLGIISLYEAFIFFCSLFFKVPSLFLDNSPCTPLLFLYMLTIIPVTDRRYFFFPCFTSLYIDTAFFICFYLNRVCLPKETGYLIRNSNFIIIGCVLPLLLSHYLIAPVVRKLLDTKDSQWKRLSIASVVLFIFGRLVISYPEGVVYDPTGLIYIIAIYALCCSSIIFVLYSTSHQSDAYQKEQQLQEEKDRKNYQDYQFAQMRTLYHTIAENNEQIIAMKHDEKKHLTMVKLFLDEKDDGKALDYLNELIGAIPSSTGVSFCTEPDCNAFIAHYAAKAKEMDIAFSCMLPLPLLRNPSDFVVILGNALDNAVEACALLEEGIPRYIKIKGALNADDRFFFTISNSYCGKVRESGDGEFYSSKAGQTRRGIGTRNIVRLATEHGGTCQFMHDNKEFNILATIDISTFQ
jgi:uncharacterized membrane protein HdeD (DUF308 family)